MTSFQKLVPVVAILISLSPIVAKAASIDSATHPAISHSRVAASFSRGRPYEFTPLRAQDADTTVIFSAAGAPNKDGSPIPNGD